MEVHGWRGAAWVGREARGVGAGREDGGERDGGRMKMEGSETGGAWVGKEEGREWEARVGVDGAGEGRWRGVRWRGLGVDGAGECMGVDACAADMLVTRTWLHHKHHCRLLRVSAQVERSMGGGSAAPCFAEARWEVSGAAGLIRWSWVSKKCAMHATDGQVVATWSHHQHHCSRVSAQVERSMGGGSAAPCFAEARWEVSGAVLHQNRDA